MRKLLSIMVIGLGLIACQAQEVQDENSPFQTINVQRAETVMKEENPLIVDVRTDEEYAGGHIEGARQINFYSEDFEEELAEIPRDQTVLVYCHSGNRSGKTMAKMKELGFEKVYNLEGGMSGWKKEGKAVAK